MPKRLQVIFDNDEYRDLQRIAKRARLTVSALVRETLRDMSRIAMGAHIADYTRAVQEIALDRYSTTTKKRKPIDRKNVARPRKAGDSIVKISSKFQVVIPQHVRESMGLEPGQEVSVVEDDGLIQLVPMQPVEWYRGSLPGIDTTIIREPDRF
jgi:AbrB family looped-hinge helix DNA binding protein